MLRHLQQPLCLHHRVQFEVVLTGAEELGVEEQFRPLLAIQNTARMYFGTLVTGQGHVRVVLLQLGHIIVVADQQALAYIHILRILVVLRRTDGQRLVHGTSS